MYVIECAYIYIHIYIFSFFDFSYPTTYCNACKALAHKSANPVLAPADQMSDFAPITDVTSQLTKLLNCGTCGFDKPESECQRVQGVKDAIEGNKDQIRCNGCNALRSRINRMVVNTPSHQHYKDIDDDTRKQLYAKAQHLLGADLKKLLVETITTSLIKRQSETLSGKGAFKSLDDLEIEYKNKPIILANILKYGARMMHPVHKVETVWDPVFELSLERTEINQEEKKRHLESEKTIKPVKKQKTEPVGQTGLGAGVPEEAEENTGEGGDSGTASKGGGKGGKGNKAKPLTDPQKTRLEKAIVTVEQIQMEMAAAISEAEAPDMKEFVPAGVLKHCISTKDLMATHIQTAQTIVQANATG